LVGIKNSLIFDLSKSNNMANEKLIKEIDNQIAQLERRKKALQAEDDRLHTNERVDRYLKTYNGRRLLGLHKLTDEGTWQILGEDPNCDIHGTHVTPHLAFVEGTLENAIIYGVDLPNFWAWGGGGEFKKVQKIVKV
jgi:hypothetical protein